MMGLKPALIATLAHCLAPRLLAASAQRRGSTTLQGRDGVTVSGNGASQVARRRTCSMACAISRRCARRKRGCASATSMNSSSASCAGPPALRCINAGLLGDRGLCRLGKMKPTSTTVDSTPAKEGRVDMLTARKP